MKKEEEKNEKKKSAELIWATAQNSVTIQWKIVS